MNVAEIRQDRALHWLGAILALANGLAAVHWGFSQRLDQLLDPSHWPAICWPFFDSCAQVHGVSADLVHAGLLLLGVWAVGVAALFARGRVLPAYVGLALLAVAKLAVVALDYRLRLNQHTMTAWLTLAFLLIPHKRQVVAWLLAAIYFWAGVLKLNPEWLDGRALYGRLPMPQWLLEPACWYVVVLELVLVFGLFSRKKWVFWAIFGQFLLFHAVSWPVVSYYYPVLMVLLLLHFVVCRAIPAPVLAVSRVPAMALVALFSLLQWTPWLFPGDRLLTGEGRLWALHMFDAPLECQVWLTPHAPDGRALPPMPLRVGILSNRILCDPVVYASAMQGICAHNPPTARHLDLHLQTRRTGEPRYHVIIDAADVCAQPLEYSLFRHNPWILDGSRTVPARVGMVGLRGR